MHYYFDVLKKYAVFSGRARRKEFWMFTLITTLIFIGLTIVDKVIGIEMTPYTIDAVSINSINGESVENKQIPIFFGILSSLYWLFIFIPSIAVTARRLHDTGRSGWWQLLHLICCVGWIVVFVFNVLPGTEGDNKYGPDPLNTN